MLVSSPHLVRIPMANLIELEYGLNLLDRIASRRIVDRALRQVNLTRAVISGSTGFLPYVTAATILESVARSMGDRNLGVRFGLAFDYSVYGPYASYVFGAPNLAAALTRARVALPLIHSGSNVVLREDGNTTVISFVSGLRSIIGSHHVDDSALFVIRRVCQRFLGESWRPAWIEVVGDRDGAVSPLEEISETPVRIRATLPGIAVRNADLHAPNPCPPGPEAIVSLTELPRMMGIQPCNTMEDAVWHALQAQLLLGDMSEECVADRLLIGSRTLQRALRTEGTTLRDVKARFLETRARSLISDSDLDVSSIAKFLGYSEPNSFSRAFRKWTGVSPNAYRAAVRRH